MLLRAVGLVLVFTGAAAAQNAPAPAERTVRPANQEHRAVRPAAQSPAERASRELNRDLGSDRFRDAASDARGDPRPTPPGVQQFDAQRRSLQPDVGRPEEDGRISPNTAPGVSGVGTQEQR
jgi:hypothetical protein